jgi:diaminohydroxyphosphoribosylaminopyrimidine deaminase/5-amino-6-(5-phosphoribosylamino)uracil reductase
MGTVQADDPLLTARLDTVDLPRRAARVVFCRRRLPGLESKLVQSAQRCPLLLIVGSQIEPASLRPLERAGAEIVSLHSDDLTEMVVQGLASMGAKQMTNVMLEGGAELIGSFFAAGQIDECHVYVGPRALGGLAAPGPIGGVGITLIDDAWRGKLQSLERFDDDFRAVYRKL